MKPVDCPWADRQAPGLFWVLLVPVLLVLGCVDLTQPANVSACSGSSDQPCVDHALTPSSDAPEVPPNSDAPVLPSPDGPQSGADGPPLLADTSVAVPDTPVARADVFQASDIPLVTDVRAASDVTIAPDVVPDILKGSPDASPDTRADATTAVAPDLGLEIGPETAPDAGHDSGGGPVTPATCIQRLIIDNGYAFGATRPCSACYENGSSLASLCTGILDCLQKHAPCTGDCSTGCNNSVGASGVAITCAQDLAKAAACPW
jgi:hypothetical protein